MQPLRSFVLMALLAWGGGVFADTVEHADDLYAQRGSDLDKAWEAAQLYRSLGGAELGKMAKAGLLIKAAEAYYFVGDNSDGDGEKEAREAQRAIFRKGQQAADTAVDLFSRPSISEKETNARALYWYAANRGRELKLSSFGAKAFGIRGLRSALKKIKSLGYSRLNYYGPNRIWGNLALNSNDVDKALGYFQEAVENTYVADDIKVSRHGLNNLYYADTLIQKLRTEEACELLRVFSELDPATLIEDRVPETIAEVERAKATMAELGCAS